jgi:GR25 family glycosyltransferase involved in LPS biosynthesis
MAEKLENKVWETMGFVSMAWEDRPHGRFLTEEAFPACQSLMDDIQSDIGNAIDVLSRKLRTEPDYYQAFQANIAVQFQDEYYREFQNLDQEKIYEISNKAAKNFLDLLTANIEIRNIAVQERKVLVEKYITPVPCQPY